MFIINNYCVRKTILILSTVLCQLYSQPTNIVSEAPIIFENGIKFSDRITVKFNKNILPSQSGERILSMNRLNVEFPNVIESFQNLSSNYGDFYFIKQVPNSVWGENIRTNKRSGELVVVPDLSQLFTVKFTNFIPVDSVVYTLKNMSIVEYVHGPIQIVENIEPNDSLYQAGEQWSLAKIKAPQAWEINKGDSQIKIAIIESKGVNFNHPEIADKYVYWDESYYGSAAHGTSVAGVVGASTDNESGVASLGWQLSLMGFRYFSDHQDSTLLTLPTVITTAVELGADIINCSFHTSFYDSTLQYACPSRFQSVSDAIEWAISQGVVIVAAGGNKLVVQCGGPGPYELYPAWDANVIGVAATDSLDSSLVYYDYNYGDSIDVSAPGRYIRILNPVGNYYGYSYQKGTSLSAPFVSALAGLMLSIDNSLKPYQIENIIKSSVDKVGQFPYDNEAWNPYLGYGRINALKALLKTANYNYEFEFIENWNLIGLPFEVENADYSVLFPTAISGTLFYYNNGYQNEPELELGRGYWLRFPETVIQEVTGIPIHEVNININDGWNLISGISQYINFNEIFDPNGILIEGTLFGYNNTYIQSQIMEPGFGYFVRANSQGSITISDYPSQNQSNDSFVDLLEGESCLKFTNSNGDVCRLHFGVEIPAESKPNYSKPLFPPDFIPILDTRTADSKRYIEDENDIIELRDYTEFVTVSLEGDLNGNEYILDILEDLGRTVNESEAINVKMSYSLTNGDSVQIIINENTANNGNVRMRLRSINNSVIPQKYLLHQNFPNPFNPTTTIHYGIPTVSKVQLIIYDILGREVVTLLNEIKPAGYHQIVWEGKDNFGKSVGSGIYIYKINVGNFQNTKKMVLLK